MLKRAVMLGAFVHPVSEARAERRGLDGPNGRAGLRGRRRRGPGILPGDIILRFDVDHRSLPHLAATAGIGVSVIINVPRSIDDLALTLVTEMMPE